MSRLRGALLPLFIGLLIVAYLFQTAQRTDAEHRMEKMDDSLAVVTEHFTTSDRLLVRAKVRITADSSRFAVLRAEADSLRRVKRPVRQFTGFIVDSADMPTMLVTCASIAAERDTLILDLTGALAKSARKDTLLTQMADQFAASQSANRAEIARVQAQLDSARTTVTHVQAEAKRRFHQKVWSVTKQVSRDVIMFGLGRASSSVGR